MTNSSISVVLPAHNEAENIRTTIDNCLSYLKNNVSDYEVIIVNDGSTDETQQIVQDIQVTNSKLILINHPENKGYGSALRSGFDKASCKYIFFMDSDGQFDVNDLGILTPLVSAQDIVIGYRENRADSFPRLLNAWLYGIYIYLLFGLKVKDMDCAFKIFPTKAYHDIRPIKSGGALFSAEFLIKLKRNGFKLREVPVRHFPRQFGTQSGANFKVILRMFKESWQLRNELRDS